MVANAPSLPCASGLGIEPGHANRYDTHMKRLAFILLLALAAGPLTAQDAPTADALDDAIANGERHWVRDIDERTALRSIAILHDLTADPNADVANEVADLLAWQQASGGWGYGPDHSHTVSYPDWSDLGNTHLAISALRLARDCGADVDDEVFLDARAYAATCQNDDGGFGLTPPGTKPLRLRGASHGEATAAGLGVIFDSLPADEIDRDTATQAIIGLRWLRTHGAWPQPGWQWDDAQRDDTTYLWRLAKLSQAAHLNSLGEEALRPLIAQQLLSLQATNGTWTGLEGSPATALAVDALRTLRRPVLINRLAEIGDTGEEITSLIDSLNDDNDTGLTWQRITWSMRYSTLTEAPIWWLVIDRRLNLNESTAQLVKRFVEEGGTLIVQVTSDNPATVEESATFLAAILPAWTAKPLTEFAEIRGMSPDGELDLACLDGGVGIGDSVRLAAVVLPPAVYASLTSDPDDSAGTTAIMLNLIRLARGQTIPLGHEPFAPPSDEQPPAPAFGVAVARVALGQEWANSPRAFDIMSDVLANAVSLGVREMDPTDLTGPVDEDIKLLWLTGLAWPALSTDQQTNLQAFLDRGGLLMVTPTTGQADVASDARLWLETSFQPPLRALASYHPLNTGEFGSQVGNPLTAIDYNDDALSPPGDAGLEAITQNDRQAVVFCPYGLLAAAEGAPAWNNPAPVTDEAQRIIANVLLYVLAGE